MRHHGTTTRGKCKQSFATAERRERHTALLTHRFSQASALSAAADIIRNDRASIGFLRRVQRYIQCPCRQQAGPQEQPRAGALMLSSTAPSLARHLSYCTSTCLSGVFATLQRIESAPGTGQSRICVAGGAANPHRLHRRRRTAPATTPAAAGGAINSRANVGPADRRRSWISKRSSLRPPSHSAGD